MHYPLHSIFKKTVHSAFKLLTPLLVLFLTHSLAIAEGFPNQPVSMPSVWIQDADVDYARARNNLNITADIPEDQALHGSGIFIGGTFEIDVNVDGRGKLSATRNSFTLTQRIAFRDVIVLDGKIEDFSWTIDPTQPGRNVISW